jgi:phage tail sheath gpL-like
MASKNISFDTIPASIRRPGKYFEFNYRLAVRSLATNLQRVLVVAPMLASGTATAGAPMQVFSDQDAAVFFGRGSLAHLMVSAAVQANRYVDISVMPQVDAALSVAAAGTLAFTGTAVTAGIATMTLGDVAVQVPFAVGVTAPQLATTVAAQLAANLDLPATFAANAGTVTGTAKNKGTVLNGVNWTCSVTGSGIAVAVTAFTGGAVDPDMPTTLAPVFAATYELLTSPYTTQTPLTALRQHLDDRGAAREQRGGYCIVGFNGVLSAATTLAGQLNAGRMLLAYLKGTPSHPFEIAAAMASVCASEEDPARPLNTLPLAGIAPPSIPNRLGGSEMEVLLANGVTPLEVGPGEVVQVVRAITTYVLDPQGVPDVSLLDFTTIRSLDYVRKAVRTRIALRFPRDKRTARVVAAVRSEILNVLHQCETLEICENVDAWKDALILEYDEQDNNRIDAAIPTQIVKGFHVFGGRMDLIL